MSSEKRRGWSWLWGKKSEAPPASLEDVKTPPASASPARPASVQAITTRSETRPLSIAGANEESLKTSELAQLQLKRVVRASSGELVAVDPSSIRILLAHMNTITQILLRGQLEDIGFLVESCDELQQLPLYLARFGPPRLVIFEAAQIRASLKFFREQTYPLLQSASLPSLLVGTGKLPEQDAAWRGWFRGGFTLEQDIDDILKQVRKMTNAKL
ncbi:hypothetical protein L6R29_09795 [Myxococcota bacterium]|nr:hypothetical protein [Myxococcota bacterium]